MPALHQPALALALLLCPACFTDLGSGVDDPASTTSPATTSPESSSSTSTATADPITSSDPSDPSDPSGVPTTCGDGQLDSSEACDDGPDNSPEGPCTPACQLNVCGDGYLSQSEPCDDGNTANGDGCTATCTPETCGDTIVAAPTESCDDGNTTKGDGCRDCQLEFLRVFVTDRLFNGDMTLPAADQACAEEALMAQLPGTYLAWLGTVETAPNSRFNAGALPYVRTDALPFASNLAALTTSGPQNPLSITAGGGQLTAIKNSCENFVWTGVAKTGDSTAAMTCDNFTSNKLENTATVGNFDAIDATWTQACQQQCNQVARVYCFQQIP